MANDPSGTVIRAAGAVLWRPSRRYGVRVAVVHRPRYNDWSLPKGKAEPGEVPPVTAAREVEEETGLSVRITGPLDSIEYWFVQSGTRIHKTVHYFLMEPVGGDLARHDHEFDEVRWIPFDQAATMLTFETERALVGRAAESLVAQDTTPREAAS